VVLAEAQDNEELIERIAALDVGKAELMCCVRVPGQGRKRLQEVRPYSTMTRALSQSMGSSSCLIRNRELGMIEPSIRGWRKKLRKNKKASPLGAPGCTSFLDTVLST